MTQPLFNETKTNVQFTLRSMDLQIRGCRCFSLVCWTVMHMYTKTYTHVLTTSKRLSFKAAMTKLLKLSPIPEKSNPKP